MAGAARIGFDAYGERANASPGKNRNRARIRRILQRHGIAGAQKCFAKEIDGLLAAVGDEQLLVA